MAPPVDPLRKDDACDERRADHEVRIRAGPWTWALAELWARGRDSHAPRNLVRRQFTFRARSDQTRLELAQELGILRERLRELPADPAFGPGAVCEPPELLRGSVDCLVG